MKPLSKSILQSLETAATEYASQINQDAYEYLTGRGISRESIDDFRLGYVVDPISGHEQFRGRIAIPALDLRGRVYSLRFRSLGESSDGPKYLGLADVPTRLFNLRAVDTDGDTICITEGEFDTVILSQCGYSSVAVTGADSWKRHHPRIFAGFRTVYVLGDGDQAGKKFAKTVTASLPNAISLPLPTGEDINSLFMTLGPKALSSLLSSHDE